MLLNKKVLCLVNVASTDQTRQSINGVYIEPDGSGVATDGHMLLKFNPDGTPDAKEYPTLDGVNPVDSDKLKAFILPREACAEILKAMPKRKGLPILSNNIALDAQGTNTNGHAIIGVTDLQTPKVFKPQKVEAEFPDYPKVIPTEKPTVQVGLAVDKLEKLVRTLRAMNVIAVRFGVFDEFRPVLVDAKTVDHDGEITGAIMPMRI